MNQKVHPPVRPESGTLLRFNVSLNKHFLFSFEAKLEEGEIDSEGDGKKQAASVAAGKS